LDKIVVAINLPFEELSNGVDEPHFILNGEFARLSHCADSLAPIMKNRNKEKRY